ncbi:MAG: leucyl/phenylalanyl-tRNA--protein transferase [Alphaproteobacteria bacterium]|nr:leucyl/phenylalanyl-tRNA--protein transferase [Rhodospirillaceae bacterium]MBT7614989.1 leucyl/phenylalanyl-tRNA--protein transferase [Rhodospirillaceae bacterium]MDG2481811.1 leucyl/phenylalanyl-tRNA--protein transferase [Alphaproteobacteria bacterium]
MTELTPDLLLKAYAIGVFPMADDRNAEEIFWVDPDHRGIVPLDQFHVPRSLRKVLRRGTFTVTVDRAFAEVIAACAEAAPDRRNTWINTQIEAAYVGLHRAGHAHSVECWADDKLVGGLYGVRQAGVFFGESMFSRVTDASKVALTHLVARLICGRFRLLDTQFITDHLQRFGAVEVPRAVYHKLLGDALGVEADFYSLPEGDEAEFVQSMTQMS